MTQSFTDNSYDLNNVVDTDMQNLENNFTTLKSAFSGVAAPSSITPGMAWLDTSKKSLKRRNVEDDEWFMVLWGDSSFKIPVYRNDQMDGFLLDTQEDIVIALNGGSQAYNVNGGNLAGSWTQPNHTLNVSRIPSHNHKNGTTDSDGSHSHTFSGAIPKYGWGPGRDGYYGDRLTGGFYSSFSNVTIPATGTSHAHGFTTNNRGSGGAHMHGTTYRPRAAICTLQYPDLT